MTLVAMPPEPKSEAEPPAIASISGVDARHLGNELRVLVAGRVGCIEAIHVRQQHQAIGADHLRDTRTEAVVVAVTDLRGRDRCRSR